MFQSDRLPLKLSISGAWASDRTAASMSKAARELRRLAAPVTLAAASASRRVSALLIALHLSRRSASVSGRAKRRRE